MLPKLFATGVLLLNMVTLLFVAIYLMARRKNKTSVRIIDAVKRHTFTILFFLTFFSSIASLIYSEIIKFPPCELCWFQRIFMYSQAPLLYVAILRNEAVLSPYLKVLNGLGAAFALYHYIIQLFPHSFLANCTASGISCTQNYAFHFGYISIPFMALSVFFINILILCLKSSKSPTRSS